MDLEWVPVQGGADNESWNDAPVPGGQTPNPVRGSMAGRLGNKSCVVLVDPLRNRVDVRGFRNGPRNKFPETGPRNRFSETGLGGAHLVGVTNTSSFYLL